jgi:hypothetical protein
MEGPLRPVVAAACAYEVYALASRRVPTLSRLCRRHRAFEALLFLVLVVHFHLRERASAEPVLNVPAPPCAGLSRVEAL